MKACSVYQLQHAIYINCEHYGLTHWNSYFVKSRLKQTTVLCRIRDIW